MGYGEFDGGGSVKWKVVHNNKKEKKDTDLGPPADGQFTVLIRGLAPIFVNFDAELDPEIRITWPDNLVIEPAISKGGRKVTGRKKTARKYSAKKS